MQPSEMPTFMPTVVPSVQPTAMPTVQPTVAPTSKSHVLGEGRGVYFILFYFILFYFILFIFFKAECFTLADWCVTGKARPCLLDSSNSKIKNISNN